MGSANGAPAWSNSVVHSNWWDISVEQVHSIFYIVRNVTKNSLFSPNFFLTLITYGLLFYSVRLHCANLHTPLPFLFYLYDFQNMKMRHPDLFCAILSKGHL